nr:asparagine synthase (glutamine-hydrolyzing) [uncultured Gellertiella sp.]
MCGIVGVYYFDQRAVDRDLVDDMARRIARRGPDGGGSWTEGPVGLGHRRLAVRDISAAGAQPFHSECGQIVVTYNGELYNDRTIAGLLGKSRGFVPKTGCDTEVIPESYLEWGDTFAERLEGIFALALHDRRNGRLLLARDANGTKPLYVREFPGGIHFSSEIKAFFADPEFRSTLSPPSLAAFLATGYVAPDSSLFAGILQVPPGTVMIWDRDRKTERCFWRPTRKPAEPVSLDQSSDRVLDTLRSVVADQVVSDVPIAVLQSGGIDSTLISACLPDHCDVRLYSVRFQDRAHDESGLAGLVAARLKRPLDFIDLARSDVVADFRAMVDAVDGSLADSSALATFQLARAVKAHATVALSGDGADEYFGGYPTYRATALARRAGALIPNPVLDGLSRLFQTLGGQSDQRIGRSELMVRLLDGMASSSPHANWRRYLRAADRRALYGPDLQTLSAADPLVRYAAAGEDGKDSWEQGLLADQRYYLPGDMLMKTDRTSMYHGLEVRVPFLDRRMCDLAASLDRSQLMDIKGRTKIVLRRAVEKLGLPAEIFAARKMGFNVPMNALLRHELRPLGDHLLDRNADILAPFLSADGVRRLWRDHRRQARDYRFVVWTLLVLATWIEDHSHP